MSKKVIICCKDNTEYNKYLKICFKKTNSINEYDIKYFAASEDIFVVLGSSDPECYKILSETVINALGCKNHSVYFSIHPGGGSKSSIIEQIDELNKEASEDDNKVIFSYHGSYNQEFSFSEDLDQILEPLISYSGKITDDNKSQKELNEKTFKFLQSLKNENYYKCLNPKIYFFDGQKLNSLEADNCNPFKLHILIVTEPLIKTSGVLKKIARCFGDFDKVSTLPLLTLGDFYLKNISTYLPVNFIDSSIWNFYINIKNVGNNEINFVEKCRVKSRFKALKTKLKLINKNYNTGLYNSTVAQEFIEFNYRKLINSYIQKPRTTNKNEHSEFISPFVFHSEYNMQKICLKLLKEIRKTHLKKGKGRCIKWNVLMIDDFAEVPLSSVNDSDVQPKNKTVIFYSIIGEFLHKVNKIEGDNKLNFDLQISNIAINKEYAEIKIKEKQNDIILLDYLLAEDTDNKRTYGDEIISPELFKVARGVLGKNWIFPISSFHSAIMSKLTENGVSKIENYWYIADGADMVCTPNLFAYNFFKLIELQLDQAIVTKNEIIEAVYINIDWQKDNERQIARMLYGAYMHKFGLREHLKMDSLENNSKFAESLLELIEEHYQEDYLLYENTRKLLYLIGFGTKQQKNELWETYKRVDRIVRDNQAKANLKIISNYINSL